MELVKITFLNKEEDTEEIKKMKLKKKKSQKQMTMKNGNPKSMGCLKSSSKREVYGNISLPQEMRKMSNKQHKLIPKTTRKITKTPKLLEGKES